jgi:guanine deaminase
MLKPEEKRLLEKAIGLSRHGMMNEHGGPFGSVIVRNNEIVGEGCNMVIATSDPTAHAEIVAIRDACRRLKAFQLHDCDIYTSCEPCPMCLGAIYWARPKRVIYANTRFDAAAIKFDDEFIYQQINADMLQRTIPFIHEPHPWALEVFEEWKRIDNKKLY